MRRSSSTALEQAALVLGALLVYLALRIVVEGGEATAHANAHHVLAFERALGLDWELSSQAWVLDRPSWMAFWNFAYRWLYWPSTALAMVVLWHLDRRRYAVLRDALFVSAGVGIVIFAVFPVSPPRFLDGYVDTLSIAGQRLHEADSALANAYAAVPSFHVGWPALAGFVVASTFPRRWVWVVALAPATLIAGAVVFTGNHFVVDIVVGLAVVAFGYHAALRLSPDGTDPDSSVGVPGADNRHSDPAYG